jgi:hypothetical protein
VAQISSIIAVNVQYKENGKDKGKIEIISRRYREITQMEKRHRIITLPLQNVSAIAKILESIIWHFGGINKRLEEIQNPNNIKQVSKDGSIEIYDDFITIIKKNREQNITFDEILSLSYALNSSKITLSLVNSPGVITFEVGKNVLDILEKALSKLLVWK